MATGVRKLGKPPINEVICGFLHEPMAALTAPVHGIYWEKRRDTFTTCQVQPAIVDGAPLAFLPFMGPQVASRTWLVSIDETRLLQLQHDRFYVNWRRRNDGDTYPRFSRGPDGPGLLSFALEEYAKFCDFCASQLGGKPRLVAVDLSKIDVLKQGEYWSDWKDLAKVVPATSVFLNSVGGMQPELVMRVSGDGQSTTPMSISVVTGIETTTIKPLLRIETRGRKLVQSPETLDADFHALNDELNKAFFGLIGSEELHRFRPEASK
jgi:hypothetical protein